MATYEDLQRVALGLPGVTPDDLALRLDGKAFIHPWRERIDPRKAKVTNLGVAVLPVADERRKFGLVAAEPGVFFTEAHYDGYASVLVRLESVTLERLREAVLEARDAQAARMAKSTGRRGR